MRQHGDIKEVLLNFDDVMSVYEKVQRICTKNISLTNALLESRNSSGNYFEV